MSPLHAPEANDLIDYYLAEDRAWRDAQRAEWHKDEDPTEPLKSWWASSLGKCPRVQTFRRLKVPELRGIDSKAMRTFAWGRNVEDYVRRTLQRMGVVRSTQLRLEHERYNCSGKTDIIIGGGVEPVEEVPEELRERWSPEWLDFLRGLRAEVQRRWDLESVSCWEVKSMNSRAIEWALREGPNEAHRYQLGLYAITARDHPEQFEEAGVPIPDRFELVYVGRDSFGLLNFPLTNVDVAKTERLLRSLNADWKARRVPDCDCEGKFGGKGPIYCEYGQRVGETTTDDEDGAGHPVYVCCGGPENGGARVVDMRSDQRNPRFKGKPNRKTT